MTIVADKKKAIFIHIEKTGGRSITKLLTPYISEPYRQKNARDANSGSGWGPTWHINHQHARFAESLSILDELGINTQEYFKFTVVRNPYARLLSIWKNRYQSPMNVRNNLPNRIRFIFSKYTKIRMMPSQHFHHLYPDGSFKSFVLFIDNIVTNYPPEFIRRYLGATDQYSYLENNRNIKFDFIGKLETMNVSIAEINDKLQLSAGIEIPHLNQKNDASNRKKYLDYYDAESLEIVNRIFARDFQMFDYHMLSSLDLLPPEANSIETNSLKNTELVREVG